MGLNNNFLCTFKKLGLVLALAFLFTNCGSTRAVKKTDTQTETNTQTQEAGTITRTRPGDTITLTVPNYVFKDTTIVKQGRASTIYANYNNQGELDITAICDELNEIKEYVKTTNQEQTQTTQAKETDRESFLNGSFIIYIFLGLAFLIIVNKVANKFI